MYEWIRDKLRIPYYLSRVDHDRKIRDRKQRTDIGKYRFVNRTIKNWKQIPAEALGTFRCKPKMFRKRVGKAIVSWVKGIEVWRKSSKSAVKCNWVTFKWEELNCRQV